MKRFYREATTAEADGGWRVLLDGRPIRTQAGNPQCVSSRRMAEWLAGEWAAQGDEIDPAGFPARDLADFAIDKVAPDPAAHVRSIMRFAETDTLCYRADPEDALYARQQEIWEPMLTTVEEKLGLRFERVSGIMHRPQRPETLSRLTDLLMKHNSCTLAGLGTLASLAASMGVGLLALEPDADAQGLWAAANLEEDWQAQQWGWDEAAKERRTKRLGEFTHAMYFARLTLSE